MKNKLNGDSIEGPKLHEKENTATRPQDFFSFNLPEFFIFYNADKLTPLGIMGTQLRADLKLLSTILPWFRRGPWIGSPLILRSSSLSDSSCSRECIICMHWENYISISFHIEWDMIVVTVFLSILNQMEFYLVQNRKENCRGRWGLNCRVLRPLFKGIWCRSKGQQLSESCCPLLHATLYLIFGVLSGIYYSA